MNKFLEFFLSFLEYATNVKHFEKKKMMVPGNVFRKLQTVKNLIRPLSKNCRLRRLLDSQHVKSS